MEDGSTESNGIINFNDLELLDEVKKGYLVLQRRSLVLRETILWGYHKLQLDGQPDELTLIVTPSNCWASCSVTRRTPGMGSVNPTLPAAIQEHWGIGDFSDLRDLVEICLKSGGAVVGLYSLHAMFLDRLEDASPYSLLTARF